MPCSPGDRALFILTLKVRFAQSHAVSHGPGLPLSLSAHKPSRHATLLMCLSRVFERWTHMVCSLLSLSCFLSHRASEIYPCGM